MARKRERYLANETAGAKSTTEADAAASVQIATDRAPLAMPSGESSLLNQIRQAGGALGGGKGKHYDPEPCGRVTSVGK